VFVHDHRVEFETTDLLDDAEYPIPDHLSVFRRVEILEIHSVVDQPVTELREWITEKSGTARRECAEAVVASAVLREIEIARLVEE
jgi:hypothetical protein